MEADGVAGADVVRGLAGAEEGDGGEGAKEEVDLRDGFTSSPDFLRIKVGIGVGLADDEEDDKGIWGISMCIDCFNADFDCGAVVVGNMCFWGIAWVDVDALSSGCMVAVSSSISFIGSYASS